MSFRWPWPNDITRQEASSPVLSDCKSKDSIAIFGHEQAAEFTGLKTRLLELISEISTCIQTLENHDEPDLAQQLSFYLRETRELMEAIASQYTHVEQLREKVNYSIAFRREEIRERDKKRGDIDEEEKEEDRRLQEEQFQREIDECDDVKRQYLNNCQSNQGVVQEIQEKLRKIMKHHFSRRRLRRLWTLGKLLIYVFCLFFAMIMAPTFEYILRGARPVDLKLYLGSNIHEGTSSIDSVVSMENQ